MGGEYTHTLTVDEIPGHTHTRGTMDIIAEWATVDMGNVEVPTGATQQAHVYGNTCGSGSRGWDYRVNFQASRNWTGETSSTGGGQPHNILPPYICTNIWRRVA